MKTVYLPIYFVHLTEIATQNEHVVRIVERQAYPPITEQLNRNQTGDYGDRVEY